MCYKFKCLFMKLAINLLISSDCFISINEQFYFIIISYSKMISFPIYFNNCYGIFAFYLYVYDV